MWIFKTIILSFSLLTVSDAFSQNEQAPFYKDIISFSKQDSTNPPPKGAILFTGSSSFTKWTNVQEMFPGHTIINRGFGGSSLPDVIRYAENVIYPYEPKQVVIYCGDNDIEGGADSKIVTERFKTLFHMIRKKLPAASIVFVSIKPSPSREKFLPVARQVNQLIKNYLWQQGNAGFVDVFTPMLNVEGKARPELFLDDMLHMKPEGYVIWQKAMEPYLVKN